MEKRNLVWLFIDSFSNLWINEDTMPFLTELLKNTLYFEQTVTVCPYTAGSWFSQVTGRYMQHNGHTGYRLSYTYDKDREAFEKKGYHNQPNLASALHDAGYYTQFSSPTVGNKDWTKGWDKSDWCRHPSPHGDGDPGKRSIASPSKEGLTPYFWAFHYLRAHHYTTQEMPKNMDRERFLRDFLPTLDEEIKIFVNHYVGPDDLLVLTSDHGSSWDGKRERHHGASMLESGIRILFAIRGAGVTGRIPQMVRSIDIGPTVAGLLGVSDGMIDHDRRDFPDGIDLLALSNVYPPRIPKLSAIIETGASDSCPHWHNIFAVRDDNLKYVFDFYDGESVYDVQGKMIEDPTWICADFPELSMLDHIKPNPPNAWIGLMRKELIAYFDKYGLTMQKKRLLHFAEGKMIDLKDYPIWYAKPRGKFPFKMFLYKHDVCVNAAAEKGVSWEFHTTRWLKENLKKGMRFIDVGAHVGYFTLLAASLVGPEGHVIAVEPNQRNADILWANVKLYGWEDRVTLLRAAADAGIGHAQLYKYGNASNHGQYTLVKGLGDKPYKAESTVDTIRIADYASWADVVKLDCEGMEMQVYQGMHELLEKCPELIIIIEDHNDDYRPLLEKDGFQVISTDYYKKGKQRNCIMQRQGVDHE